MTTSTPLTGQGAGRRRWLAATGAGLAGAALPAAHAQTSSPAAPALTAPTTEGPYYLADPPERADITEGLPGIPLELQLSVADTAGRPLAGLPVDVWHCDAQGLYSGFAGQGADRHADATGRQFLRGRQRSDADGRVRFRTVYPGWYQGRTTHIHLKVWSGARQLLTTQFFLPDALSEFLYTQLPAYRRTQLRDVLNSNDGIALEAGDTVIGAVREAQGRYLASLALVVDPARDALPDRPPAPPAGGSGGRPPPPGRRAALEGEARIAALVPGARR